MSAPQILRSAHGSPSRVRGPENQLKPPAYVAILAERLAAIHDQPTHWSVGGMTVCSDDADHPARPVSGCCPVCRTAVA